MLRPIFALGRAINTSMRHLGSGNAWQALRHAGLLLGGIWAVFLLVLSLLWFAVMAREEVPYQVLLVSFADCLLFVAACFLGVRIRLKLPLSWVQVLILVLVGMLFLPAVSAVLLRTLPLGTATSWEILRYYYGWFFDAYTFTILGLMAGLNVYYE